MKIYITLICLTILFAQANASTIGVNTIGVKLGGVDYTEIVSVSGLSTAVEFTGFGYQIGGNLNFLQPSDENKFGLDLPINLLVAPSLENGAIEVDGTRLNAALRPYIAVGNGFLFADLGVSYLSVEISYLSAGEDESETTFAFGVGAELNLSDSFRVTPSLNWASYDAFNDTVLLTVPVSYTLSETLDISFVYEHTFFTDVSIAGVNVEREMDAFLLGLDMKF